MQIADEFELNTVKVKTYEETVAAKAAHILDKRLLIDFASHPKKDDPMLLKC